MTSRKVGKGGVGMALVALAFTSPTFAGQLTATGQTTSYQADKNDGIVGPVDVSDDGVLQEGKKLKYKLRKDGTVEDVRTGLIWEVKCDGCGGLHDVNNTYVWSGNGSQETIWDWLDDVNAEGGTGYAGHNDWRIPNLRELQSIVDYGVYSPATDPIFGPFVEPSSYWSSTTNAGNTVYAWIVLFSVGYITPFDKSTPLYVRAVRGGK